MSDFEIPNPNAPKKVLPDTPSVDSEDKNKDGSAKKKEPQYSKEELLKVFDEIIFSGEYSEEYLVRGKLPVTLRTRTAEEINQIQKNIDAAGFNLISSVENMRSLMNLQYSLMWFNGKDLSGLKFEEKVKFVERLPAPMVGLMFSILSKFDHKVASACEEGNTNF